MSELPVKKPPRRIVPILVAPLPAPMMSKAKLSDTELLGEELLNKIINQTTWDYSDLTKRAQELNALYPGLHFTEDDLDEPLGNFVKSQQNKRGQSFLAKYEAIHQMELDQVKNLRSQGYSENEAYRLIDKMMRKDKKSKKSRSNKTRSHKHGKSKKSRSKKPRSRKHKKYTRADIIHSQALVAYLKRRNSKTPKLRG